MKISESSFAQDFDRDKPFLVQLSGTTSFPALAFVDGDEFVIFAGTNFEEEEEDVERIWLCRVRPLWQKMKCLEKMENFNLTTKDSF